MTTDRELLELAAKAAGIKFVVWGEDDVEWSTTERGGRWNPLTDDGDALRLAVKLRIAPSFTPDEKGVFSGYRHVYAPKGRSYREPIIEPLLPDECAAWRRAVVRLAAEIGRRMP